MNETNLGGRLPLVDPKQDTLAQKKLRRILKGAFVQWAKRNGFVADDHQGRPIGPFNVMLTSPEMGAGLVKYLSAERKNTSLTPRVREVIILTVGAVWKSAYELYAHVAVAKNAGLPPAAIDSIASGQSSDLLDGAEQAAWSFTRELVADHRVTDSTYRHAVEHFGEKGVVELVHLVSLYLGTCALLNAFEVPVPA